MSDTFSKKPGANWSFGIKIVGNGRRMSRTFSPSSGFDEEPSSSAMSWSRTSKSSRRGRPTVKPFGDAIVIFE